MAVAVQSPPPAKLEKYTQVAESQYQLRWADLVTLDLSQFDVPGGKQKLAHQLRDAVHNVGFFYITNFGLPQDDIDRQFAIGKSLFALPTEEKLKYRADLEHGSYNGYRPIGMQELFPGMTDNFEMYNIFKFSRLQTSLSNNNQVPELERTHPAIVNQHHEEIEQFQRKIAQGIVQKLLVLIALVLELPEDYLTQGHEYDDVSDCHLRYMIYRARTTEENERYKNIYSQGHSDFGSLTLLFRQPIAALQILTSDGSWKWVKPNAESITVNIADVLQFWSGGYLKSSIHRVVAPPPDQAHMDRLGLLYFLRPAHDLKLKALDSPLLKRLGRKSDSDASDEIKAGDWVKARVKGNLDKAPTDGNKEKVVLNGVKALYYA